MNKRYYEHTLPIIRGSLSNTYFVQKHETKTAETGENDGNLRKTSNDIRRKQQLHPRKTITASEENGSNIQEKQTQKSYEFCTKA